MNFLVHILISIAIVIVGGKDLNFYIGPQALITNKSMSEEEKTFGKTP